MKILLICKGEYRYFFPAIAKGLRERHGARMSAVVFASPAARMLEKTQVFSKVSNLAEWLKVRKETNAANSLEVLRNLEALHGEPTINTMIHADRILNRYPEEETLALLACVVEFWKNIWEMDRPDAIVGEVACATEWIAWLTASEYGIPYFIPCPTPIADRFFFLDAPDGFWRAMASAFRRLKKRQLTRDEAATAEAFVHTFRAKKTKPPFLQWAQSSPLRPPFSRLAHRIPRIPQRIQTYIEDGKFEIGSYHGTPPWQPIWQDFTRMVRHCASESAIFAHRFDAQRPSVYFPLHVQPEFTTDVRAPFFANQIALVENISKSVPPGYQLLVKEHPGMKGERNLGYYRQLKKFHNVHLLSPSLDSHDLIQASDVVLTITGSSAWEAILYEKPVIAFGPLCYEFYDLIHRCESVAGLPELLPDVIDKFVPSHTLLLKLVCALFESAHELQWGDPIRQPQISGPRNCDKIADAIAAELAARTVTQPETAVLV